SVNGRSLDIRLRLPQGFEAIEKQVRELTAHYIRRGNCQINLNLKRNAASGEIRVNEEILKQVIAAMGKVSAAMQTTPPAAEAVLALKGILEYAETELDEEAVEARNTAILNSLEDGLKSLDEMRAAEGEKLGAVLAARLDEIESLTREAEASPARQSEVIMARLKEQVLRLMQISADFDEARLHQEAALLAAKADIREELDRLYAHVEAARALLAAPEPVGRKLDFLTQEFNREANTLCSKSNAADLTGTGLKMKAVIDQIREQVQNLE
ncbi:MAG TPA: YicC family protein, partial [Rhizobiales bacterium]|nr:YicC family protein [Hyphomicrobiales bacterium]